MLEQASKQDVHLVAFPETFLSGYPFRVVLGGGGRFGDPEYARAYAAYLNAVVELNGPEPRQITGAARPESIRVSWNNRPSAGAPGESAKPAPATTPLYLPTAKVLFCGDSMLAGRDGQLRRDASTRTWDEEKAEESVRTQQALRAEIVCPGHGPVVRPAHDMFPVESSKQPARLERHHAQPAVLHR